MSRRRLHGYDSVKTMFCALVEAHASSWREAAMDSRIGEALQGDHRVRWQALTAEDRLRWLFGQLWVCAAILPSKTCDDLELAQGSNFGQAVRKLQNDILSEMGVLASPGGDRT